MAEASSTDPPARKTTRLDEVYDIHADVSEVLYSAEDIASKIKEMGAQVAADYSDKMPIVSPILKGGFVVAADLLRAMQPCPQGMELEFIQASSYGNHTETSGKVAVSFNSEVMKGRHVLLVDDLCDSGLTLLTVHELVMKAGAASVKSLVLLDKKERRKVDYVPDYIGFTVPNKWLVGAGMDTCQLYRGLSYVGVLHSSACQRITGK